MTITNTSKATARNIGSAAVTLLLIVIATVGLVPFALMFVMSTQDNNTIFAGPSFLPGAELLRNFDTIMQVDYFRALFNSVAVAACTMALTVFFSAMAGFGFSKYNFKHKKLWFNIILLTMMVPVEIGLVAFVWEMRVMNLSRTLLPLILPNVANAFGVFWMTQYMRDSVPYELLESGRLDGCNDMGVFLRIILPMIRPAVFTLGLIIFLQSWNNYLLPMVLVSDPKLFTIPLLIASLGNMYVADYGARLLGVAIGVLPILIVFLLFSKQVTQGLAAGAVKG